MHELPVTEKILDIALRHAAQHQAKRILAIALRVGGLTDLEDTWLQHYFDYLSRDTIAAGAKLQVIREPIRLRCTCMTLIETPRAAMQDVTCPHCGATEGFRLLSGREYVIEEITAQ